MIWRPWWQSTAFSMASLTASSTAGSMAATLMDTQCNDSNFQRWQPFFGLIPRSPCLVRVKITDSTILRVFFWKSDRFCKKYNCGHLPKVLPIKLVFHLLKGKNTDDLKIVREFADGVRMLHKNRIFGYDFFFLFKKIVVLKSCSWNFETWTLVI